VIDCFIGLGANLGDRSSALAKAVELLAHEEGFALRAVSRAWESEPVGPPQPRYLNAVARVSSMLSARATMKRLHEMEEKLGRIRREKWGPREIDLDLLFYGDAVAKGPLELPHPRLQERSFVLGPLRELAPVLVHPVSRKSVSELWSSLSPEVRGQAVAVGIIRRRLDGPQDDSLELLPEGAGADGASGA
jgi:2-amino-4-hydroxy-6-hydroxymethyldihydropteridine diphosphokinase